MNVRDRFLAFSHLLQYSPTVNATAYSVCVYEDADNFTSVQFNASTNNTRRVRPLSAHALSIRPLTPIRVTRSYILGGYISMTLVTNVHHVSGHC